VWFRVYDKRFSSAHYLQALLHSLLFPQQRSGTIALPQDVFGVPVRGDILHRVVIWQLACKRQGTASTKNRAEKSGSGRKIHRQKGSGLARAGQVRSPTRRGGGPAHGPRPRDWKYHLPVKVQKLGLKCALSAKFAQQQLSIIDETNLETHKTKNFLQLLRQFGWKDALIIDKTPLSPTLYLAHRNIPCIEVISSEHTNVYDILHHPHLLLHKDVIPFLRQLLVLSPVPLVGTQDFDDEIEEPTEGEENEEEQQDDLDEFYAKHIEPLAPKPEEQKKEEPPKKRRWFWQS